MEKKIRNIKYHIQIGAGSFIEFESDNKQETLIQIKSELDYIDKILELPKYSGKSKFEPKVQPILYSLKFKSVGCPDDKEVLNRATSQKTGKNYYSCPKNVKDGHNYFIMDADIKWNDLKEIPLENLSDEQKIDTFNSMSDTRGAKLT